MLSVVIPTYKRPQLLRQCLQHLAKQTIANRLEVIVVSDGADNVVEQICTEDWGVALQYAFVPKSQQGAARNKGVTLATKTYCLFTQDDCFLVPTACEEHLKALQMCNAVQPTAVLGFTTWDPTLTITPLMKWLEQSGWQFGFPAIQQYANAYIPTAMQHSYNYTINLSLPTALALQHTFLEGLTGYGWEDMEWGLRLQMANIGLYYAPSAIGHHHHPITLQDSLKRSFAVGRGLPLITKKNPTLQIRPFWLQLAYNQLRGLLPDTVGKHRKAFAKGLQEGLRTLAQ